MRRWVRGLGVVGFGFFLVKGLIWLSVSLLFVTRSCLP